MNVWGRTNKPTTKLRKEEPCPCLPPSSHQQRTSKQATTSRGGWLKWKYNIISSNGRDPFSSVTGAEAMTRCRIVSLNRNESTGLLSTYKLYAQLSSTFWSSNAFALEHFVFSFTALPFISTWLIFVLRPGHREIRNRKCSSPTLFGDNQVGDPPRATPWP